MATIWDDKNHSPGEEFILTNNANNIVKKAFEKIKFPATKISDTEFKKAKIKNYILIPENLKEKSNDIIFYFESDKKSYMVRADSKLSNSYFKWSTKGTSTDRQKMTEIKETCSMLMIEKKLNTGKLFKDDEELILEVKKTIKDVSDYWKPVYFTSALEHAIALDSLKLSGQYDVERQQKDFSKIVYRIAKKISGKAPDNWNPSDIWLKRKGIKLDNLKDFEKEINTSSLSNSELSLKYKMILDEMFNNKELIGISLKQIDKGKAKLDLVSYNTVKTKIGMMDFSKIDCFIRVTKDELPAYGELRSKSGFNIKWGGRANARMANINLEGQMSGSTHQLGAIDSKVVNTITKDLGFNILKDSDFKDDERGIKELFKKLDEALKIIKEKQNNIYNMYFGNLSNNEILSKYGFIEVKRFIAQVSVFNFINSLTTEHIMDFFILAKKVDKINPIYYILH